MVQPLDHLAVLAHPIVRVERIAPFRREKVHRVIAPVEAVAALNRGNGRLLLRAIRRKATQVKSSLPGALIFVDAGEMKARQQMDGLETGIAERFEMLHAVGAMVGKGQVSSAMSRWYGRIVGAEIAYVKLVDAEIVYVGQRGRTRFFPTRGLRVAIAKVGKSALHAIKRKI